MIETERYLGRRKLGSVRSDPDLRRSKLQNSGTQEDHIL